MSAREMGRHVLVAIGLVALALVAWMIAPVLMLAFAALVLAAMVRAAADPLSRRTSLSSHASVALVVLVIVAALAAGAYFFGREVAAQADALWKALLAAYARAQEFLARSALGRTVVENVQGGPGPEAMAHVAKGTVTVFSAIADVGLALFLALYIALDPQTYRRGLLRLLPSAARPRVDRAIDAAAVDLRKWLLGQLGAMVTVGVAIGAGLLLVGAPLAVPLGVLSALLEFVPVVGPITATVIGVLIAFAQGPQVALYAAGVYVVVLFLEGNVIIPIAQKWAVALPPALGLIGIAIFGILFGVVGVLFAMPLMVVVVRLVEVLYVEPLERTTVAAQAFPAAPDRPRAKR